MTIEKEKREKVIAAIGMVFIFVFALLIIGLGLKPLNLKEPVCVQASFMHGGVVKEGECSR